MKILIDIGHPAHVHYFKNFIRIMQGKGHEFIITARDKEVTFNLLHSMNLGYFNRGKGRIGLKGKIVYLIEGDYFLYKIGKKYKPDIYMSFGSSYAAHAAKILGVPHIAFDDTEHAKLEHLLYVPFTSSILTPFCFHKDLGKNQIKFDGYMELCALHPNYFIPDPLLISKMKKNNEKVFILRFVSWEASHDVGHKGIDINTKRMLIKELSDLGNVYISSEKSLPEEFLKYQLQTPPEMMHHILATADLFIGEGATMASECAVLGTPAIYVNSLELGYCTEQEEKYNLIYNFRNSEGVVSKALELAQKTNIKQEWQNKREKMLREKIDVTAFMSWFIENYPKSKIIMRNNPDYQYRFK